MKKSIIALLFLLGQLQGAEDLFTVMKSNSWKSNSEKTIKWLEAHNEKLFNNKQFVSLFGKMVVKFHNGEALMFHPDNSVPSRGKLEFIRQIGDQVVFQAMDPYSGKEVARVVEFDEDRNGYSVFVRMAPFGSEIEFREYFDKQ